MAWFNIGYAIAISKTKSFVPVVPALVIFVGGILGLVPSDHGGGRTSIVIVALGVILLHSHYHAATPNVVVAIAGRYLGMLSFPLYPIHAPAGRLLPQTAGLPSHWFFALAIIGTCAVGATIGNEYSVKLAHPFVHSPGKLIPKS